jgi:hypothetical protein
MHSNARSEELCDDLASVYLQAHGSVLPASRFGAAVSRAHAHLGSNLRSYWARRIQYWRYEVYTKIKERRILSPYLPLLQH